MQNFEDAIVARLEADASVSAQIGRKDSNPAIAWDEIPQGYPVPFIRLQVVTDDRPQHLKGYESARPTRVQMDVVGERRRAARRLTEAAIDALVPVATVGGVIFNRTMIGGGSSGPDRRGEQPVFRIRTDLIFTWSEED